MIKKLLAVSLLSLLCGLAIADRPPLNTDFSIQGVNAAGTNGPWRVWGTINDTSPEGYGVGDVVVNNAIYNYSSAYGDWNRYQITSVVYAVGNTLTCDVVFAMSGYPRSGGPEVGTAIICGLTTNGVPVIPAFTWSQAPEALISGARNDQADKAPGGGSWTNTGDWAGTWQSHAPSYFYLNSDPSNFQGQITSLSTGKVDKTDPRVTLALTNNPGWATNSDLVAHTTNTAIHVSASDRTNWNGKATLGDVAGVGYITNNQTGISLFSTTPATVDNSLLVNAGFVRNLFNSGSQWFVTSNAFPLAADSSTLALYSTTQAVHSSVTYSSVTNGQYVGTVCTTNTVSALQSPVIVDDYLEMSSMLGAVVTVHPEIYYTYATNGTLLGDWEGQSQTIAVGTNLYSWVVSFPTPTLTGSVYVVARLKVTGISGIANLIVHAGGGTQSRLQFTVPSSGNGGGITNEALWIAASNAVVYTNDPALTDARAPLAHDQGWTTITGTPTTVAGYGITDGATGTPVYTESDPVWAGVSNLYYPRSNPSNFVTAGEGEPLWTGASNTVVYTNNAEYLSITTNASSIGVSFTPTNSEPSSTDVQGNLVGIDAALGGKQPTGNYATGTPVYVESDPAFNGWLTRNSISLGNSANGSLYGIAGGYGATGYLYSVAIGYLANGNTFGVALGPLANALNEAVAVGYNSSANTNNVAIGYGVVNTEPNSTILKGNLNGQGYRSTNWVNVVETNGNGSGLTGITAAQVGAVSTNGGTMGGNINLNGNTISNGAVSASSLQVTGGAATNSVLVCTNSNGQQGYLVLAKIEVDTGGSKSGIGWQPCSYTTTRYKANGTWDGTNWTPGVVGWIKLSASAGYLISSGRYGCSFFKNGGEWRDNNLYSPAQTTAGAYLTASHSVQSFNDSTNNYYTFEFFSDIGTAVTNASDKTINYFSGSVSP